MELQDLAIIKKALQSRINNCQYMATKVGATSEDMSKNINEISSIIPVLAKIDEQIFAKTS